jgi:UDP-2,3-diacylglucosamine pyrophosphatase LpxH
MHTLVLSDIHLGNGEGYDIFSGEAVLPATLAAAAAQRTAVILNGDTFDFLMNEDPLELHLDRAVAQAQAIVHNPASAAVLKGLGAVLAAGGSVEIRLGNHDAELALHAVQEVFRGALGQPPEVAARLVFTRGDAPGLLELGGTKILLAHGEHNDPWNFVDYAALDPEGEQSGKFHYPPGSRLVKTLLNPLKRRFGMRFADLLKPDFQGGVLTVLAVDPNALGLIFQGSTFRLLWQLFRRLDEPVSFEPGQAEPDLGLAAGIEAAGLTPEEHAALEATFDPDALQSFGAVDNLLGAARVKLARQGLRLYASAQRSLAGTTGDSYFSLTPDPGEWDEARRLATKYDADAVVLGHTHAARFRSEPDLTYVNTGTWIYLMRLPAADASVEAWEEFLSQCRTNPGLDPKVGPCPAMISRPTGLVIDPDPAGGVRMQLLEFGAGGTTVLAESRVARRGAH